VVGAGFLKEKKMKEYLLGEHSKSCDGFVSHCGYYNHCNMNPERFLFFFNSEFYLVTYFACLHGGEKYTFRQEILESLNEKIFPSDKYYFRRDAEKDLRDFRIRGIKLQKYIYQVHYKYCDNAKKIFVLTSTTKYLDRILDNQKIKDSHEVAYNRLTELGLKYMHDELFDLYCANNYDVRESEIVKNIEHLIQTIKKETDDNQPKSQLRRTPKTRIRHNDAIEIKSHIG
jgi:hypothetical protein